MENVLVNSVMHGDVFDGLSLIESESVDLIYTDPPFNTGDVQVSRRSGNSYQDYRDDYIEWTKGWLSECHRVLKDTGTIYLHLDDRSAYKVRLLALDDIFGENNYLSTVIWSYNFGGRGKDRWPAKHDTILVYTKNPGQHTFNWNDIDRIPYVAPALQYVGRTKEDAEKRIKLGQVPTDVWSMSIVGTASKERTGYPTQKPLKLIERVIRASSNVGDLVLDPFGGSGTTAMASHKLGRRFIVIDKNPQAIGVMTKRLTSIANTTFTDVSLPVIT